MLKRLIIKLLGLHGKAHKVKDDKDIESTYTCGL